MIRASGFRPRSNSTKIDNGQIAEMGVVPDRPTGVDVDEREITAHSPLAHAVGSSPIHPRLSTECGGNLFVISQTVTQ
jgi:hypothetical protein